MENESEEGEYFKEGELNRIVESYSKMLSKYVIFSGIIENEVEKLIAIFYFFDKKKQHNLIQHLIIDLTISNKIRILDNLISQKKYKHLKTEEFLESIEFVKMLIKKRNKIVHSVPAYENRNDRVSFINKLNSYNQTLHIKKEDVKKDQERLLYNCAFLYSTYIEICKVKYKDRKPPRYFDMELNMALFAE